jgi:DNA-binding protein HU-beta
VLDLVAALEASLAKAETAKERHPTGAASAAKPAAKATKATTKKAAAKKAPAKAAAKKKSA